MSGPAQLDFFGEEHAPAGLRVQARVRWICEIYPETCADDNVLFIRYLQHFGNPAMPVELAETVIPWVRGNELAETVRRRRQELNAKKECLPSPEVQKHRQARAGAGPVR